MPRYKLTVAYDGTDFHGWQKQHPPGEAPLRTVQGVLEESVRAVVREPVNVLGASRTDSGVHARGQVATFASETPIPVRRLARALNSALPDDVVVLRAQLTHAEFNPIQDALAKGYRYRIAHGLEDGTPRPVFDRRILALSAPTLDPEIMHAAAQALVGEHDFASFTRKHHGRESTVRRVDACTVTATSRRRLRVDVSGNGFLYNMVRIIVGTLVEVGKGRLAVDALPEILAARDRAAAGPTMPPEGLCLQWIRYPAAKAAERAT